MFKWLKFFKKKTKEILVEKIIKRKIKFPCEDCLILPLGCKQLCDKVEMDNEKLRDFILENSKKDRELHCPDCGCVEWYNGPSGGLCINCKCSRCGHWFNLAPGLLGFERVHVDSNGRIY
jgi:hypothetical protein